MPGQPKEGQPKETKSPFPTSPAEDVPEDAEKRLVSARSDRSDCLEEDEPADPDEDDWDSSEYDMSIVTSWRALFMFKRVVFKSASLWKCIGCNMVLSFGVALVCFFTPDMVFMNFQKLQKLSTFLNVFVGLMLGFFLTSAMTRWYACVNSFCELLDAVRTMQMNLTALGVKQEHCDRVTRYGVLSAWLLLLTLNEQASSHKEVSAQQLQATNARIWQQLEKSRPHLFEPNEKSRLLHQKDSFALLWTWVASWIGRMSQDGEIPPMASPTYGKLLNNVQWAYNSIRDTRGVLLIKNPLVFIHTLGVLVHVNNILNAICFGTVLGTSITATIGPGYELVERKTRAKIYVRLVMQLLVSMLGPILYLAIFSVSVCVNQPFLYEEAKIPALRFLKSAELDLAGAAHIGANPPGWSRPHYKTT